MQYLLYILYASLATLGFSVLFNIRGLKLIPAVIGGTIGWTVFMLASIFTEFNILAVFFAAVAIGIYAEIIAVILKQPATIFIVPGIIPLVPGSGMYYTMASSIHGEIESTLSLGMETIYTAGAIAAGIAVSVSLRKIFQAFRKAL